MRLWGNWTEINFHSATSLRHELRLIVHSFTSTMWLEIFTAIAKLQTCMVTITRLLVWVLVNDINRRLLHHTRWVSTVATQNCFATRTGFCLFKDWHKHQAPDDALHMRFHFIVDRDFHLQSCWHFSIHFYGMSNNPRKIQIDTLSATFQFRLFAFTLEHFLFAFHNLILSRLAALFLLNLANKLSGILCCLFFVVGLRAWRKNLWFSYKEFIWNVLLEN